MANMKHGGDRKSEINRSNDRLPNPTRELGRILPSLNPTSHQYDRIRKYPTGYKSASRCIKLKS